MQTSAARIASGGQVATSGRTLLFAGLFMTLVAVAAFAVGYLLSARSGALVENGVEASAVVTRKVQFRGNNNSQIYRVFLRSPAAAGLELPADVTRERFASAAVGEALPIVQLPRSPDIFAVGTKEDVRATLALSRMAVTWSPLLLIAGLLLAFIGWRQQAD